MQAPRSITHNGYVFALNPYLLEKQNIDPQRYEILIETHRIKLDLLDWMRTLDPVRDRVALRRADLVLDRLFYVQQAFWGFPLDPNFHKFWIVPHCTCPKTENEYLYGSLVHIIEPGCPVHSGIGG